MSKTLWQWLAAIMYFVGLAANAAAWITLHTWLWAWCMLTTIICWGIALSCVIFKPVSTQR